MIIVTTLFVTCEGCGKQVPESDAVKFGRVEEVYTAEGKLLLRATSEIFYVCKPCYKAETAEEDAQYAAENE